MSKKPIEIDGVFRRLFYQTRQQVGGVGLLRQMINSKTREAFARATASDADGYREWKARAG